MAWSEISRAVIDLEVFLQPRSRSLIISRYSKTVKNYFDDTHRYLHECSIIQLWIWVQGYYRYRVVLQKDWTLDRCNMRVHRYVLILIVIVIVEIVIVVQYGMDRSLSIRTDRALVIDLCVTLGELNRLSVAEYQFTYKGLCTHLYKRVTGKTTTYTSYFKFDWNICKERNWIICRDHNVQLIIIDLNRRRCKQYLIKIALWEIVKKKRKQEEKEKKISIYPIDLSG